MTWLVPTLYVLSAATVALAWALVRKKPEHVPVAALLTLGLACDVARRALTRGVLLPAIARDGDAPFTGGVRAVAHVDDALFLAWPAALAACSLAVFLRRRPWPVILVYVAFVAAIAIAYPMTRDGLLARAYTGAELFAVMVSLGAAIMWYRSPSKVQTTTAQSTLVVIVASELASVVGSWRLGIFDNWHLTQIAYLLMFAVLIVMQGGLVWQSRSS
jgi:hypothetical protein